MENLTKKEWIIRLMQGMIGDYGSTSTTSQCWYNGEAFRMQINGEISDLDINWVNPTHNFRITDTKGVPMETITLCNMH